MLPKRRRLSAEEVRTVLKEGRSVRTSLLSAKYVANTGNFRVSAVISKKVAKKAVIRNRMRRALYRALVLSNTPKSGMAVIFIQKLPTGVLTPAFSEDLMVLLSKLS